HLPIAVLAVERSHLLLEEGAYSRADLILFFGGQEVHRAQLRSRIVIATAAMSGPIDPPPFCASPRRAPSTCRVPVRPRSWSHSSTSCAQPVAPMGWPRLSSPPPVFTGTRPPRSVAPLR